MDGLFYLIGVILLLFFAFFLIKIEHKRTQEEILRRETIKNTLSLMCEHLEEIKGALWYEK